MELELSRAGMSVANCVLDSIGSGFAVVHFQNGRMATLVGRNMATVGGRRMERHMERRRKRWTEETGWWRMVVASYAHGMGGCAYGAMEVDLIGSAWKGGGGKGRKEDCRRFMHEKWVGFMASFWSSTSSLPLCFFLHPLAALPTAWAAWGGHLRRLRSPGRWRWPPLLYLRAYEGVVRILEHTRAEVLHAAAMGSCGVVLHRGRD